MDNFLCPHFYCLSLGELVVNFRIFFLFGLPLEELPGNVGGHVVLRAMSIPIDHLFDVQSILCLLSCFVIDMLV